MDASESIAQADDPSAGLRGLLGREAQPADGSADANAIDAQTADGQDDGHDDAETNITASVTAAPALAVALQIPVQSAPRGAQAADLASTAAAGSAQSAPLSGALTKAHAAAELATLLGDTPRAHGDASAAAAGAAQPDATPAAPAAAAPDATASAAAGLAHLTALNHDNARDTTAARGELRSPPGSQDWNQELGRQLTWMSQRGIDSASLRLSPEHLGPLEVRIAVQNGAASVWFGATHADTRAALERALPQLRQMFASQGLALTDSGVSREPPRNAAQPSRAAVAGVSVTSPAGSAAPATAISIGLVDTYV